MKLEKNIYYAWYVVFFVLLIQELIIKINTFFDVSISLDRVPKLIVVSICGIYMIINKKHRQRIIPLLILGMVFLIGHGVYNKWEFTGVFFHSLKLFIKYTLPLVTYIAFSEKIIYDKEQLQKTTWLLYFVLLFNSFFILIGAILGIEFLRSYPYSSRFGYLGLFFMANDVTMLYVLALCLCSYRVMIGISSEFWILVTLYICSFFIGTKAIILFNILLFIIYLVYYFKINDKVGLKHLLVVSFLFGIFLFVFLNPLYSFFKQIWRDNGILYALSSFRSELLIVNSKSIFNEWNLLNWMFGGVDFLRQKIEMDFFDAFFFWGVIGSIVYFYLLFKNIIVFKKQLLFRNLLLFLTCLISFLAGHLLWSGLNSIYLVIFAMNFNSNIE